MKIFNLNENQIALLGTVKELETAEQIMLAGGRYSINITTTGDIAKAFVWGITEEVKNRLYAFAGQGSGIAVEGVQPDSFKMPEKTIDPELENAVNQALDEMQAEQSAQAKPVMQVEQQPQPEEAPVSQESVNTANPYRDKLKAITQNAYTYCVAAYSQLYSQLYGQACPDVNSQEFAVFVNGITSTWMNMVETGQQEVSQWLPWIDYIYDYGTAVYKASC